MSIQGSPLPEQTTTYERRLCAFIDILGFRQLIRETEANPQIISQVEAALARILHWRPEEMFRRFRPLDPELDPRDRTELEAHRHHWADVHRSIAFSDSIFVSTTLDANDVHQILYNLNMLCADMVEIGGRFLRGAIVIGHVAHSPHNAFGPGFVRAYDLEQGAAIYPRVVIEPSARAELLALPGSISPFVRRFFRRDFDGFYHLDFLGSPWQPLERRPTMDHARPFIEQRIVDPDPRIAAKYRWLAFYYNEILDKLPEPQRLGLAGIALP